MELRKLLIAEGTEEFMLALTQALEGAYRIQTCQNGKEALELMRSFAPDLVVLDLMLPGMDGISVLQAAREEGLCPVVLATSRLANDYVMDAMERLNVGYLMRKPCDVTATVNRLTDLSRQLCHPVFTASAPEPRTQVTNVLRSLGIQPKHRGYMYLREAVLLFAESPGQSITKELYPAVAEKCKCESTHVERSSRSAIQAAWKKRNEEVWRRYFEPGADGNLRRPTNGDFVAAIAEMLQQLPKAQGQ